MRPPIQKFIIVKATLEAIPAVAAYWRILAAHRTMQIDVVVTTTRAKPKLGWVIHLTPLLPSYISPHVRNVKTKTRNQKQYDDSN
jgi:hypothetical protein